MNPLHRSLNRRDFLRLTGSAALGLAATSLAPNRLFAQSSSRAKELNILCWEGYNSDNVLNPFRALHKGISLKAESGTDDPSMINKLRAGEIKVWDLINLNQCWARQQMWGEKLIKPLNRKRFEPYIEKMMPMFCNKQTGINPFALSPDGKELIGMMQRFGPMNFVINTKKISIKTAEDEGLPMFLDPKMKGKYGLLAWDNWNVLHMCVTAGFTPYKVHTPEEVEAFRKTARTLFSNAAMISGDPAQLNQALINGEIDAIYSGGTYTCSVARYEGFNEVYHISPRKGPVNGKGSLQWFEVTSVVNNPDVSPLAEDFLEYVQQPDICHTVAMAAASHNPVTQMSQPEVFSKFTKQELNCFQWETLEEDMTRSADYEVIPDNDLLTSIYLEAKRSREA
ncbi:MAG: PotD/PotF family extracellular solute-binding protein [Opitutaceae bacterium]|nr:PotD/PotF family extracellular solute-binding protein [Opitutaceae bacterium]